MIGLTWRYRNITDLDAAIHQAIVSGAFFHWRYRGAGRTRRVSEPRTNGHKHKRWQPLERDDISGNCKWLHHNRCYVVYCRCSCHLKERGPRS